MLSCDGSGQLSTSQHIFAFKSLKTISAPQINLTTQRTLTERTAIPLHTKKINNRRSRYTNRTTAVHHYLKKVFPVNYRALQLYPRPSRDESGERDSSFRDVLSIKYTRGLPRMRRAN